MSKAIEFLSTTARAPSGPRKTAIEGRPYVFEYWDADSAEHWKDCAPEPEPAPRLPGVPYVEIVPNYRHPGHRDKYASFAASIASGKSYMVGKDVPDAAFIKSHRSPLTAWQREAFAWAQRNPYYRLRFTLGRCEWEVYSRGEYVELALPHQDAGGERHYISQNGRSKILVNVD